MNIKPNKDGSKLEQAYYWLFKGVELELAHARAPTKVNAALADKAFQVSLELERAWFQENPGASTVS